MVARLTPDQKAACSNHVGVSSYYLLLFFGDDLDLQRAGQKREKRKKEKKKGQPTSREKIKRVVLFSGNLFCQHFRRPTYVRCFHAPFVDLASLTRC